MNTLLEPIRSACGALRLPGLETLLTAATLAPSGDNMQPWNFDADEDSPAITVAVDPTRDTSPMNAGQRMARVAVGAAVENIVRTATYNGWRTTIQNAADGNRVRVEIEGDLDRLGVIDPVVERRVTNRRFYDARPLPGEVLAALQCATPTIEGVATHWITDRDELAALATLIGQADALMFGDRAMRAAFLANVRFDLKAGEHANVGLPLGALELSRLDGAALRLMPFIPDRLLKLGGAMRKLGRRAKALINSSSGLILVVARNRNRTTDLSVGRAFQCAWLMLTDAGLAAQPMMSIPVLAGQPRCELRDESDDSWVTQRGALALLARCTHAASENELVGILRFGYGPPIADRAHRRPWGSSFRPARPSGNNAVPLRP